MPLEQSPQVRPATAPDAAPSALAGKCVVLVDVDAALLERIASSLPPGWSTERVVSADSSGLLRSLERAAAIVIEPHANQLMTFRLLETLRPVLSKVLPPIVGMTRPTDGTLALALEASGIERWLGGAEKEALATLAAEAERRAGELAATVPLMQRFESNLRSGDLEDGRDRAVELEKAFAFNRHFFLDLGYFLTLRRKFNQAALIYRQVIARDRNYLQGYLAYQLLLERCGKWTEVVSVFERALALAGTHLEPCLSVELHPIYDAGQAERLVWLKKLRAQVVHALAPHRVYESYLRALIKLDLKEKAFTTLERILGSATNADLIAKAHLFYAKLLLLEGKQHATLTYLRAAMTSPTVRPAAEKLLDTFILGGQRNELSKDPLVLDPEAAGMGFGGLEDAATEGASIGGASQVVIVEVPSRAPTRNAIMVEQAFDTLGMLPAKSEEDVAAAEDPMALLKKTGRRIEIMAPPPTRLPKLRLVLDRARPPEIRVAQAFIGIKATWQQERVEAERRMRVTEPNHNRRIVFFHHDEVVSAGFARLFRDAGYHEVIEFQDERLALDRIRAVGVNGLIGFYESASPALIRLLQELAIARYIEHIPTAIFCNSQEKIAEFRKKAVGLPYDGVYLAERSRTKMERMFNDVCEPTRLETAPGALLDRLRHPWLRATDARDRYVIGLAEAEACAAQLAQHPGYEVVAAVEEGWVALAHGNVAKARSLLDKALAAAPDGWSVGLLEAKVKAVETGDVESAALAFVEKVSMRTDLTSERLYQAARICEAWYAVKALGKLVKAWSFVARLADTHTFAYVAARFFAMTEHWDEAKHYIVAAVAKEPLRGDYLQAFGEILHGLNDYQRAAEVWRFALSAHASDKSYCKTRLAEALILQRRRAEGEALLNEVLKDYPDYAPARELLAKRSA